MRPFDLEAAKRGEPVCTGDGRPVRIICTNCRDEIYPIVALINTGEEELVRAFAVDGVYDVRRAHEVADMNLMMVEDDPLPVYVHDYGEYGCCNKRGRHIEAKAVKPPQPTVNSETDDGRCEYVIGDAEGNLLTGVFFKSKHEVIEAAKKHAMEEDTTVFVLQPIKRISKQLVVEDWDKI